MKVTKEQIHGAYETAKAVFGGEMSAAQGAKFLHVEHGLNKSSAKYFIADYRLLRQGDLYTRTLSSAAADVFLGRIFAESGPGALATAIASVRKHIDYYEKKRGITLDALPAVVARHQALLDQPDTLAAAEKQLAHAVAKALADGPAARRARLREAPAQPTKRTVTVEIYARSPDVIAEVLDNARGVCGVCGKTAPFLRRDGSPYLEVHHRVRLADGGEDTVENAVATCPNCHREAHFGVARAPV